MTDLQFASLGGPDAADVIRTAYARDAPHVWTHRRPLDDVLRDLESAPNGPLYGIPFSVKDNIDVAGLPTTAACPDFAYVPAVSAPVVDRLLAAGAILVGKNNLDQFATGLTGTRSPYGACATPFDARYISGGSSSGSAVAVAAGLVGFSIGTDTAGSGRVPAALCNVVGLKPSRGLVSTRGIVPACPSLDCPSVFALNVGDAAAVLAVIEGQDPGDPWSVARPPSTVEDVSLSNVRLGVPREREFGGDREHAAAYAGALARLSGLGATLVPIDLEPFLAAGRLLYGPWVAERWTGLGDFVTAHPGSVHPVTRQVLSAARNYSAAEAFGAMHRLRELRARTEPVWADIDALALPTVPTTYTIAEVHANPVRSNAFLGYYTHFANLLDLAALAVPAAFTPNGLPVGLSFLAPAGRDGFLAGIGAVFHAATGLTTGATGHALAPAAPPAAGNDGAVLAVVGAHRRGQPLHHQLLARGAVLIGIDRTAPCYRMFQMGDRPGLVRVSDGGAGVEVELYRVAAADLGELLVRIPAPLGLGSVTLADGRTVVGFLAESYAVAGRPDITGYGSWPAYLSAAVP
ncbi:allophanate hydrolase [Virgisporangium aliadipatigenens]|uniref:Allophanate hydrolase n=1 Tax=Virgisporangium aliadipatigenens TaxID=741659 RepID=A0A8J3YVF1_9ACTN|nr:allophanate hydrolase [Virgisporangium aliadipatigenens]GIJ50438.1 allophanate hydrolase [Virgisporangium aliadipatigenens]